MINKLLLVRTVDSDSTLTERAGVSGFVKGSPVAVRPRTWSEEHDNSHWAYVLGGMKLKDLKALQDWIASNGSEGVTLHEYNDDLNAALAAVGLQVHESA